MGNFIYGNVYDLKYFSVGYYCDNSDKTIGISGIKYNEYLSHEDVKNIILSQLNSENIFCEKSKCHIISFSIINQEAYEKFFNKTNCHIIKQGSFKLS